MPPQTHVRKLPFLMRVGFIALTAALVLLSCGLVYRLQLLMEIPIP